MTNLLSNAVKFTIHGTVTLSVSDDGDKIRILVKDTGCGMKKEFQEIIFQPFTQEDTTYGRTQTGTGLGMAIISELVQLLNGAISVQSIPDKGTTFTVELPLHADADQNVPAAPSPQQQVDLGGIRILMAEDNAINSMIAEELLTQAGAQVKTVENGRQAGDYFLDPDAEPVDLILMDIRMPVMDGLEACTRIRAMDRGDGPSVPILAMTANAFEEDKQKAFAAGMTGYLVKPLDIRLLVEELKRCLG